MTCGGSYEIPCLTKKRSVQRVNIKHLARRKENPNRYSRNSINPVIKTAEPPQPFRNPEQTFVPWRRV